MIDALHMAVMIGTITPEHSLSSHVGIGSKEHCLADDFFYDGTYFIHSSRSKLVQGYVDISLSNIWLMKAGIYKYI